MNRLRVLAGVFLAMVLSAGAQLAQASPPKWECEARPALGMPTFLGMGGTILEAKQQSLDNCHGHGHLLCFADTCLKVADDELRLHVAAPPQNDDESTGPAAISDDSADVGTVSISTGSEQRNDPGWGYPQ